MAQLKDLLVSGASRFVGKLFANDVQITTLNIPTTSGGTTYGPGTNNQVLVSNGSSVYWNSAAPVASKLGTNAGSTTQPIYFADGIPKAITGSIANSTTGNAATATAFSSNATVTLTGDATGTSAGSTKSWTVPVTLATIDNLTAGTYGQSTTTSVAHGGTFKIPYIEVDAKGRVIAISDKTITLPGSGNTDTKVTQTAVTASGYTNWRTLVWGASNSGTEGFTPSTVTDQVYTTNVFSVQPSTGTLKATTFKGNLTGNVTGNVTGNADTATTATKLSTDAGTPYQPVYFSDGVPVMGSGNSIEYIAGTQTGSTGSWTGVTKDTELYVGKTIAYRLPYAGSGNASLTLTFPDGTTSAAGPVYAGTTRLTTHYPAASILIMVWDGSNWRTNPYYNTDSNTKLRTYASSTNINVPLLGQSSAASTTADWTSYTTSYKDWYGVIPASDDIRVKINLSTGVLTAPGGITANVTGNLTGNASTATSATTASKATAANLTTTQYGIAYYSDTAGTFASSAANTTTTRKFLRMTGTGSAGAAPAWDTVTKSDVGLGNVENTKLSTWAGSANITTIGTLSSGTVPWARLSNVPSSFTPSSHAHGNVTNAGAITVSTMPTIEEDDFIVIVDSNDSSKITKGPSFDGITTTKALTPKGTWETFNNYSLPLASSSTRGGVKIGYTTSGKNYAVQLSNEQMYVNVPWTDTNTHYTTHLITASSATGTSQVTTETTSPYLNLLDDSTVRDSVQIKGGGSTTVKSSADGKIINITSTDTNTHNTAYLYVGTSSGSANAETTNGNTYLILKDGSSVSSRNLITGAGATTVSSNASGTITINSANTWTAMVGATSSANGSVGYVNAVPPKDGYNTKYLRADGTWTVPPNTNTHYTTHLRTASAADSTAQVTTATTNPYLNLLDDSTIRDSVQIKGGGATSITTSADGKIITISSTDNNTTYGAGTGLSLSGTTFNHSNSVSAKTTAAQSAKTLTWGGTFTLYEEKYDAQGHITGVESYNMTMPSNPNTNTTYSLGGALTSSHKFTTTLTPSSGSATTSDITFVAGSNVTLTSDTTNRKITIASSYTNTDTKVSQSSSTTSNWRKVLLHYKDDTAWDADVTSSTNVVYAAKNISVQPSTGTLKATAFEGNLTGNVTGNVSGSSGSCTGNAATATKVYVTNTTPSSGTMYYLTYVASTTSGNQSLLNNPRVYVWDNGTNNFLCVGSSTNSGGLTLRNANGKLADIVTSAFTANRTLTLPDASGTIALTSSDITGNAATATKLATARNLGVALGSTTAVTFDGSANQTSIPVSGTLGVGNGGTGKASWTKGGIIYASATNTLAQVADGSASKVLYSSGSASYGWLSYASTNTASTLVYRDGSGNFSAGTITATLSGNASSATKAYVTNTTPSSTTSYYLTYTNSTTSGNQDLRNSARLYFYDTGTTGYLNIGNGSNSGGITLHNANGKYGDIVTSAFSANRTYTLPDATGTIALTSSSITGNAATATKLSTNGSSGQVWAMTSSSAQAWLSQSSMSVGSATNATNASNIYSSASTSKAYVLGTTTASSANHATVYNASVYTQGSVLYGAAWNDYAEYRETTTPIEPGRVVIENGNDTLSLSTERMQPGAEIVSDTFGFAIGETEKASTPIAATGRVLAYPNEPRETYKPGQPVCSGPNGTISQMTNEEASKYPWLIIGTVSAIPDYETWGENNIKVNGRIWIRIR